MIKLGGLPPRRVVATRTVGDILARRKLSRVRILMTSRALFRGRCKINVTECGFQIGRPVTINAGHSAMGSDQGKAGLGMIEAIEFLPVGIGMARLAARGRSVCSLRRHCLAELAAMGVLVARGTAAVFKTILYGNGRSRGRNVALDARNSQVRTIEGKARLLVAGQCELRRPECL